ncbi:MAG TPA: hypothetical protein VF765_08835 [Polyangiaceae bacterium]
MNASRCLLFSVPFLALAACGGHATTGASPDANANPPSPLVGVLKDAGQYDPGGDAGAFTASQVQAALAHCDDPHGPAVDVTDGNDEEALLVGAWVLCPGGPQVPTVFSPGMILTPGGAWRRLAWDADGKLVAPQGVQDQGQWRAGCEASSDIANDQPCVYGGTSDVTVGIQAASRDTSTPGCYGGAISFESSPRRMYVVDFPALYCDVNWDGGTFDVWLVPL